MKHNIFGNPALKIASLILGILVWYLISSYSDPMKKQTFEITIEIQGADEFEAKGKTYSVDENSHTVMVTVRGKRSVIEKMTPNDIRAVADLTQGIDLERGIVSLASDVESSTLYVPIQVSCPKISSDNISMSPINLKVYLENITDIECDITARQADDGAPERGFEVDTSSENTARGKLKIKGPESLISIIDSAKSVSGMYNVSGQKSTGYVEVPLTGITIKDRNGDPLSSSQLSLLKYSYNNTALTPDIRDSSLNFGDSIRATLLIQRVVDNVKLVAETVGTPEWGYKIDSITVTPDTIQVEGSEQALRNLEENYNNTVTLAEKVDVEGRTTDIPDQTLPISNSLPEGIVLSSTQPDSATVSVKILSDGSQVYEIETKDIERRNLGENYTAVFTDTKLELRIRNDGSEESAALNPDDLAVYVDLKDLTEGEQTVQIQADLPEGYSLVRSVTAGVTISKKQSSPPESETNTASGSS